ncbi:unnamed protein product [Acanthosepion pharaonis]|uniref:Uncharacterized protein n=1 Tax=Acanthosepion pharaonis TaxID=158019 RepID=A0A812E1X3_ACAPH|nr:unnamed protein product [Sepia pharaonis]
MQPTTANQICFLPRETTYFSILSALSPAASSARSSSASFSIRRSFSASFLHQKAAIEDILYGAFVCLSAPLLPLDLLQPLSPSEDLLQPLSLSDLFQPLFSIRRRQFTLDILYSAFVCLSALLLPLDLLQPLSPSEDLLQPLSPSEDLFQPLFSIRRRQFTLDILYSAFVCLSALLLPLDLLQPLSPSEDLFQPLFSIRRRQLKIFSTCTSSSVRSSSAAFSIRRSSSASFSIRRSFSASFLHQKAAIEDMLYSAFVCLSEPLLPLDLLQPLSPSEDLLQPLSLPEDLFQPLFLHQKAAIEDILYSAFVCLSAPLLPLDLLQPLSPSEDLLQPLSLSEDLFQPLFSIRRRQLKICSTVLLSA